MPKVNTSSSSLYSSHGIERGKNDGRRLRSKKDSKLFYLHDISHIQRKKSSNKQKGYKIFLLNFIIRKSLEEENFFLSQCIAKLDIVVKTRREKKLNREKGFTSNNKKSSKWEVDKS